MFPPDKASFSEPVQPVDGGDVSVASSHVGVMRYSLAAALRTPFFGLETEHSWAGVAVHAHFGRAGVQGSRSISNCIDCTTNTLDLAGGWFWRIATDLTIRTSPSRSYGLTAGYQAYLGDAALAGELQFGVSMLWF